MSRGSGFSVRKMGWLDKDATRTSPLKLETTEEQFSICFKSSQSHPNPLLLCKVRAWEEERNCNSMLTILKEKQPPDSQLGCSVRTFWRSGLSVWLQRKSTSKSPPNQSQTNKPLKSFWRWSSFRNLLLQSRSERPYLVVSEKLHICQSVVESLQPCFMSSPLVLRNKCFLEDGELGMLSHEDRAAGGPFLETGRSPVELGSCKMFRVFHRYTSPELRLDFREETDSDMEELLLEDKVDEDGEDADTDWTSV